MRILLSIVLVFASVASAAPDETQPSSFPPGYLLETIATPEGVQFGVAGLDVAPNGDVYAATRFGDVWRYRGGTWSLFADGLHEPTGLLVEPKTGHVLVNQKPEFTRLIDEDNDGTADLYQCVSDAFGFSGNYHEFNFGPVMDSKGNLYATLNLGHGGGKSIKGSTMSIAAPYRGTCYKVSAGGSVHGPVSWGLRSPAGIGIDPRNDDLFYTDNQGDWNASSSLHHITPGRFHGHPASLVDHPDFQDRDLNAISDDDYDKLRKRPAVWIPHGELANSPGNPVVNVTGGKFGPFEGQLFVGDQTRSNLFRCVLEKVDGEYQGAAIEFLKHLQCGAIRIAFAPDGSLWVGQTSRGWGSAGGKPFGVQRITYDGKTVPFEMQTVSLTRDGFDITYTKPVDPKAAADLEGIHVKHWGYMYHAKYGSPKVDETTVKATNATVSADGRTVSVKLPTLVKGRVYAITLTSITSGAGEKLTNKTAYYTLNRLRK